MQMSSNKKRMKVNNLQAKLLMSVTYETVSYTHLTLPTIYSV